MSQQRRSGDEDLTYREWHRAPNLPGGCYMYDIDALEARSGGKLAALIETKRKGWMQSKGTEYQLECLALLGERAGVPALLVEYEPAGEKEVIGEVFVYDTIGQFHVTDLATGSRMTLSEENFRSFIEHVPESVARLRQLCLPPTPN